MKATLLLIVSTIFIVNCAANKAKPTAPTAPAEAKETKASKANEPMVPEDTTDNFLKRYYPWITKKDEKAFKAAVDKDQFVKTFWQKFDFDPTTPENEYKESIDQRIAEMASEPFFADSDVNERFDTNDGYRGAMAHVFLLYGMPTHKAKITNSYSFDDLMLWMYIDENGRQKYRFLFYRKLNQGPFLLFRMQNTMFFAQAIAELSKIGGWGNTAGEWTDETQRIYEEIMRSEAGVYFILAIAEFSEFPIRLDQAMEPPKSPLELYQKSKASIVGDPEKVNGNLKPAECSGCASTIPATIDWVNLIIHIKPEDIDWQTEADGQRKSYLSADITLQDLNTKKIYNSKTEFTLTLVDNISLEPNAQLPPGRYRVNIYLRNKLTNKYNAWIGEYTRQ